MKALTIAKAGEISIVTKEKPTPKEDELLIKILAVALNHRDQYIREGKYPGIIFGTTLGADACGTIEDVGTAVSKKWLNQEVIINPNIGWGSDPKVQAKEYHILGTPSDGVFTEYICVPQDKVAKKPEHLTAVQAAALPLAGMTAFRALFHHGQLKKGQKVLISGVGGGVAQFAFQFALAAGAEVFVTSSDQKKREKCIQLGAKAAFDYHLEDWIKTAKNSAGGFDLVIDSAGGKSINDFVKIMNPAGKIVFYGATTGKAKELDLFRMFWNQITLQGSTMANDQEFIQMVEFAKSYQIIPIIDSVVPFEEIEVQFNKMRDGQQFGKLVAKL
ncbi:MAG: zinc-binding alcohol dehydrogenase/oxidoreductase [Marivirga sp.]|jgi:zinc-binding alcohol dehydrogenase/oxidoreductase